MTERVKESKYPSKQTFQNKVYLLYLCYNNTIFLPIPVHQLILIRTTPPLKEIFITININHKRVYFQSVWAKFADLSSNPVVFSVVLATLGIYVMLIVWGQRKDRKDLLNVGR